MPFASGPQLCYVGMGQYETTGSTVYVGSEDVITIPEGFPTDLATVPRIFWSLLPPHGAYENAAVLHDWLCVELGKARRGRRPPMMSSRDVDGIFRRVMRESGVPFPVYWLMWVGVRWGALANPARRGGWWRDAPLVTAITALLVAVGWETVRGLDWLAHTIAAEAEAASTGRISGGIPPVPTT